jgi:hypothetical protein
VPLTVVQVISSDVAVTVPVTLSVRLVVVTTGTPNAALPPPPLVAVHAKVPVPVHIAVLVVMTISSASFRAPSGDTASASVGVKPNLICVGVASGKYSSEFSSCTGIHEVMDDGARIVKLDTAVAKVTSVVVTSVNAAATLVVTGGFGANAPLPVVHVSVSSVEMATSFDATVNVTMRTDDVAAATVALLGVIVQSGTIPVTKTSLSAVIVIVSDT